MLDNSISPATPATPDASIKHETTAVSAPHSSSATSPLTASESDSSALNKLSARSDSVLNYLVNEVRSVVDPKRETSASLGSSTIFEAQTRDAPSGSPVSAEVQTATNEAVRNEQSTHYHQEKIADQLVLKYIRETQVLKDSSLSDMTLDSFVSVISQQSSPATKELIAYLGQEKIALKTVLNSLVRSGSITFKNEPVIASESQASSAAEENQSRLLCIEHGRSVSLRDLTTFYKKYGNVQVERSSSTVTILRFDSASQVQKVLERGSKC